MPCVALPPRHLRRLGAVLAAALAAAALGGCGEADPPTPVQDRRISIALDDFFIEPKRIRARPGPITFAISNRGRLGHNFHLRRGDGEPLAVPTIFPGETELARVRLRRGDYRMVCTVANHEELGMTGTLIVR
jgi:plastocyanin